MTLVMLPGLDGTGKLFQDFIGHIAPAISTRIIGYPVDQALGYEELIPLVERQLPATPYFLLAESFAGPIGIALAARAGPALRGLILCGTFASNPFPRLAWATGLVPLLPIKSLPRWLRSLILWGSGSLRRAPRNVDRAMAPVARSVITHRIRALLKVDVRSWLRQIRVPVLVLSAPGDQIIRKRSTVDLLSQIPTAEHVQIAGPHLLLQARPAECAQPVLAFIETWSAAGRRAGGAWASVQDLCSDFHLATAAMVFSTCLSGLMAVYS
jgi:pimeloyl-[acyl-carrier protein] methyl ester esterase